MSYRPEGWANPHPTRVAEYIDGELIERPDFAYLAYEAGADAMLEALKEEGVLDAARAAIKDAIACEDGLDGATGEQVIRWITDILGDYEEQP